LAGKVNPKTGHLTTRLFRDELLKIRKMPERIYITHPKPQYFKTIRAELQRLHLSHLSVLREGKTIQI